MLNQTGSACSDLIVELDPPGLNGREDHGRSNPRILVVDDSATTRCSLARLLESQLVCSVVTADNVDHAIKVIEADTAIQMVLTDLIMPDRDGLELVQYVRQNHPQIPVMLMTGRGNEEIAMKALMAGAISYVPKRNLNDHLVPILLPILENLRQTSDRNAIRSCLDTIEMTFVIGNRLNLISSLIAYMRGLIEPFDFLDETILNRCDLCLHEALMNAIVHGNLEIDSAVRRLADERIYHRLIEQRCRDLQYAARRVTVTLKANRDHVCYKVEDQGPGFDPTRLPCPSDPANLELTSGRGLFLIRTFMDEVQFGPRGVPITMIKHRPSLESDTPLEAGYKD